MSSSLLSAKIVVANTFIHTVERRPCRQSRREQSAPPSCRCSDRIDDSCSDETSPQLARLSSIMAGRFVFDGSTSAAKTTAIIAEVTSATTTTTTTTSETLLTTTPKAAACVETPRRPSASCRIAAFGPRSACSPTASGISSTDSTASFGFHEDRVPGTPMDWSLDGSPSKGKRERPCKGKRERVKRALALVESMIAKEPDRLARGDFFLPQSVESSPSSRDKAMARLAEVAAASYASLAPR